MSKTGGLTACGYRFGSCQRKKFKGYSLYDYFELSEFSLTNRHGDFLFTDYWFEYLCRQQLLAGYSKEQYEKAMRSYFQENPWLWELTNEELYEKIKDRQGLFFQERRSRREIEEMLHKEKVRILTEKSLPGYGKRMEDGGDGTCGIDQRRILKQLLGEKKVVVIAVCDLRWIHRAVRRAKKLQDSGKKVYLLLKEKSDSAVFTAEEFKKMDCFKDVPERPQLLLCEDGGYGLRFDRIRIPKDLSEAIADCQVLLLGFGEDVLLSVHDLSVPSVICSQAESVYAKSILNTYDGNAVSTVYVPEEFNIFPYVPVIEAPEITYAQYAQLAKEYGTAVYQMEPAALRKQQPEYFINLFSDRPGQDAGYYPCSGLSVRVETDPPAGMTEGEWENMEWSFGGGMMLIERSQCIFSRDPLEAFRQEGWLTPLSVQAQESSVHDETQRHPRTMIGLCGGGRLFILVFSGRSRFMRGVTYREACTLAMQYIPDIQYMMSVDGGASSFLGIAGNDTFMELSYPACNIENGTGTVRRVNSIFIV